MSTNTSLPIGLPTANPDPAFSQDGRAIVSLSSGQDIAQSVAVQSDGKIVLAGNVGAGTANSDFALARYNANGSLDTSFSGDGMLTAAPGPGSDVAQGVAIAADGKILMAGYSNFAATNDDFVLLRFNADEIGRAHV